MAGSAKHKRQQQSRTSPFTNTMSMDSGLELTNSTNLVSRRLVLSTYRTTVPATAQTALVVLKYNALRRLFDLSLLRSDAAAVHAVVQVRYPVTSLLCVAHRKCGNFDTLFHIFVGFPYLPFIYYPPRFFYKYIKSRTSHCLLLQILHSNCRIAIRLTASCQGMSQNTRVQHRVSSATILVLPCAL